MLILRYCLLRMANGQLIFSLLIFLLELIKQTLLFFIQLRLFQ
jgi:hypothetical protein